MSKTIDRRSGVVEVEFRIQDAPYPFIWASREEECTFELARMISRNTDRYSEFFAITGTTPDRILSLAESRDSVTVHLLSEYAQGGLFEFLVSGDCPAYSLAERGALPQVVKAVNGAGKLVAEIPPQYDAPEVVDGFLEAHPNAELAKKREKAEVTPQFTMSGFPDVVRSRLTERQHTVLRVALEEGYYEWPRTCTGQDVAAQLGISSATFSEHIHAAERKLITLLFERSESA